MTGATPVPARGFTLELPPGNFERRSETAPNIGEMLLAGVPMARILGLEVVEATAERAALRLPDREDFRNHVGGPHAGAVFTLGESASGAVVIGAFGDQTGRAVPLAVKAEIGYRKLAMGAVTATAVLGRPRGEVVAELDAGRRPEFPVHVEITREDGAVTGEMTVTWTLRPRT